MTHIVNAGLAHFLPKFCYAPSQQPSLSEMRAAVCDAKDACRLSKVSKVLQKHGNAGTRKNIL